MQCGPLPHACGCWIWWTTVLMHNELSFDLQRDSPLGACQKQTISSMWLGVCMVKRATVASSWLLCGVPTCRYRKPLGSLNQGQKIESSLFCPFLYFLCFLPFFAFAVEQHCLTMAWMFLTRTPDFFSCLSLWFQCPFFPLEHDSLTVAWMSRLACSMSLTSTPTASA